MRKPSTEIYFDKIIQKAYTEKVVKLLRYIAEVNNLKDINSSDLKAAYEPVKNYSILVKTYRYKNQIWLRAFKEGVTDSEGYRFESPFF
ncbi:hypothetical protein [Aquimarina algiphila]|uniref:hypothetical protein n=1 Tax=Aquimarina algiphila TaxID=2047982 RepID=UPI00232C7739|nr:hypothetical protein [Aquimarina algiphila]